MKYRVPRSCGYSARVCMYTVAWSFVAVFVEVFLYVHRNRRFIREVHLDFHTAPELWGTALKCCFTSTETVGLLGTGAQEVHLDFHTAPDESSWWSPPRLSHSSWWSPPRLSHSSCELREASTHFNVLMATILSLQVLESAKHLKRQPVNPTHPPVCSAVQWATTGKEMLVNVNDDRTIPMINPGQYNWTYCSQWSIQGTGFAGLYLFFIAENANSLPSLSVLTESYSCIYADLSTSTVKWHLTNLVCWTLIMKLVQDERLTRDRKVVGSIPCNSGRRFSSPVSTFCADSYSISVPAPCYRRSTT